MLFDKWAEGLPNYQTAGVQTVITDRIKERITGALAERVLANMEHAVAIWCIEHGQAPTRVFTQEEYDAVTKNWQVFLSVETAKRPLLAGYVAQLENTLTIAAQRLAAPWWKLAWQRFRGPLTPQPPWLVTPDKMEKP